MTILRRDSSEENTFGDAIESTLVLRSSIDTIKNRVYRKNIVGIGLIVNNNDVIAIIVIIIVISGVIGPTASTGMILLLSCSLGATLMSLLSSYRYSVFSFDSDGGDVVDSSIGIVHNARIRNRDNVVAIR